MYIFLSTEMYAVTGKIGYLYDSFHETTMPTYCYCVQVFMQYVLKQMYCPICVSHHQKQYTLLFCFKNKWKLQPHNMRGIF